MTMQPTPAPGPRRPLTVLLVALAFSAVFLDYWEYSKGFHGDPDIWASTLRGAGAAPAQYRIGVLKAAEFLTLHTPFAMRHMLALIDFAALLIAAFVLRALLARSPTWRSASPAARWFGAAAFVVLIQYSLLWLIWYQRPETLTIAALLALSLWLSTHRLPGPAGAALTALGLILLGILQGFTRADAGFAFHLGIALAALSGYKPGCPMHTTVPSSGEWAATELHPASPFALPRWPQFTASLAAAIASAAAQLYIMRVLYPHATYGSTPRFQLLLNVTDHLRAIPFILFLIPTFWVAGQIARRRFTPSAPQAGLLAGSALFIVLWCILGKIDEVRIFLPFAFALTPLTVEAAMRNIAVSPDTV
jgi:hypothetical protein